jgi:hypothetical protein
VTTYFYHKTPRTWQVRDIETKRDYVFTVRQHPQFDREMSMAAAMNAPNTFIARIIEKQIKSTRRTT